jgi:hypothetical protein
MGSGIRVGIGFIVTELGVLSTVLAVNILRACATLQPESSRKHKNAKHGKPGDLKGFESRERE